MRRAIATLVLMCGCFSEGGAGERGDDDDDEGTENGSESGSGASMSSTSMGETTTGSQSGSASSTSASSSTTDPSDDTGPEGSGSEDTGTPACGELGEPCCAGDGCNAGACHRERCVVFAGAFAEPDTCGGCITTTNGPDGIIPPPVLPYLAACDCPAGFVPSDALYTTSDYCPEEALLHTPTDLRVCAVEDPPPGSDWTGAYVTSTSPECMVGEGDCAVPNNVTGACSCPDGNAEVVASTWGPCGGDGADTPDQPLAIHVCVPTDVTPISFGGAYQTRWTNLGQVVCAAGNPHAGSDCDCPPGFAPEGLRITSPVVDNGGELFFCVAY